MHVYNATSSFGQAKAGFLKCFIFYFKDELIHELKQTLNAIKLEEKGVYVQASTLGSLEALLEFLKTSEVPVSTQDSILLSLFCYVILAEFILRQVVFFLVS